MKNRMKIGLMVTLLSIPGLLLIGCEQKEDNKDQEALLLAAAVMMNQDSGSGGISVPSDKLEIPEEEEISSAAIMSSASTAASSTDVEGYSLSTTRIIKNAVKRVSQRETFENDPEVITGEDVASEIECKNSDDADAGTVSGSGEATLNSSISIGTTTITINADLTTSDLSLTFDNCKLDVWDFSKGEDAFYGVDPEEYPTTEITLDGSVLYTGSAEGKGKFTFSDDGTATSSLESGGNMTMTSGGDYKVTSDGTEKSVEFEIMNNSGFKESFTDNISTTSGCQDGSGITFYNFSGTVNGSSVAFASTYEYDPCDEQ